MSADHWHDAHWHGHDAHESHSSHDDHSWWWEKSKTIIWNVAWMVGWVLSCVFPFFK